MLKYNVQLNTDNIISDTLPLRERYVSPDLSFISGVTDAAYHISSYATLQASNSLVNGDSTLTVSATNVTREGFIIIKNKEYDVKEGHIYDYSPSDSSIFKEIRYKYITINGKFYYLHELDNGSSGFTISDFLIYDGTGNEPIEYTINATYDTNALSVKIDTIAWIEDGIVSIDGNMYMYDKNENGGILKYTEDGAALPFTSITKCDGIEFYPYSGKSEYKDVTKLVLTKAQAQEEDYISIGYCGYFLYVRFKDNYCKIVKTDTEDGFIFQCQVPSYLISGNEDSYGMMYFDVLFFENGDESPNFDETIQGIPFTSEYAKKYGITSIDDLSRMTLYVNIESSYFRVENDIINSNGGREIMIQLSNSYAPLMGGSFIELSADNVNSYNALVYISQDNSEQYIVMNGIKYPIVSNIQDKAVMDGQKYDIEYTNGKYQGADCMVLIDNEQVPMKILNVDGGEFNGGQLQKYGLINSGNTAVTCTYDIKPYNGVVINEKTYIAYYPSEKEDGTVIFADGTDYFVALGDSYSYKFIISEVKGSSLLICKPYLNTTDFSTEMRDSAAEYICRDVVENQASFSIYIENKIFGSEIITDRSAFQHTDTPISSDDFYNLFDDLSIYVPQGFINIHLPLYMNVANNINQEDIVQNQFFEKEKTAAINPIVDMEKDVYVPKVLTQRYEGAASVFADIEQINFNLHFRTRNLDTWKITDSANDYSMSGQTYSQCLDNWFVTDFYPYRGIISNSADTLVETSDLMGLLYFTNDDVFYQRDKIAKSFLRLSYYDSPDPQTQSLLATSCIFMDEHKAYKTYIDNSRKNIREYGQVEMPIFETMPNGNREDVTELDKLNKISVLTEYLGTKKENKKYYNVTDANNILIDESKRISSRLIVSNKYSTDTSSEGYYLYMFKEYSEKLHPKPIYMKIEFNHAGIGRTIPFIIPMLWEQLGDSRKDAPVRALSLNTNDLPILCKGVPLSHVYVQTYIPLYAVYDFINQEYCYVFDSRYVTVGDDGIANINLFEMKIQDETSIDDNSLTGVINVNDKQFTTQAFSTLML